MAKQDDRSKVTQSKLGRGLGSLIPVPIARPDTGAVPAAAAATSTPTTATTMPAATPAVSVEVKPASTPTGPNPGPSNQSVQFIPTRSIQPGKYQPRGSMDPAALETLAKSIEQSGLMQPIVVRRLTNTPDRFELIAGERRWRAMDRLGRTEIPAIVQQVDDAQAAELALIENLQREDLNPIDRATALRRLADEFSWTHQELSNRVGLDRATVSNLLRLNDLDPGCAAHVRTGALTLGHAKVLLGLTDVTARRRLADQAVSHDWSVRQLEAALREQVGVPRGTTGRRRETTPTHHLADLRRQLEAHLGTRVDLRVGRKKGAGELRIQFFSLDDFDGLMQRIGFKGDRFTV